MSPFDDENAVNPLVTSRVLAPNFGALAAGGIQLGRCHSNSSDSVPAWDRHLTDPLADTCPDLHEANLHHHR